MIAREDHTDWHAVGYNECWIQVKAFKTKLIDSLIWYITIIPTVGGKLFYRTNSAINRFSSIDMRKFYYLNCIEANIDISVHEEAGLERGAIKRARSKKKPRLTHHCTKYIHYIPIECSLTAQYTQQQVETK